MLAPSKHCFGVRKAWVEHEKCCLQLAREGITGHWGKVVNRPSSIQSLHYGASCPGEFRTLEVKFTHGDWDSLGAARLWTYKAGGNTEIVKETLEHVDDEDRTVVFRLLEGEITNSYKSWSSILNVTPMGEGSLAKWTVEYEKQNENIPDPLKYGDFLTT
ncbi:hypothetical protein DITRI_Ditri17bG0090200 [Diplodiscus trichospermus]